MKKGTGQVTVPSQTFTDAEVMKAHFHLEAATESGVPIRKLYLRTYELADAEAQTWHALPEDEWPLLASISPTQITMHPIHVNPHAQRYLSSKNGRFTTIIYVDEGGIELPDDAGTTESHIELHLPWKLFDPPEYGSGLHKELYPVWQGLSSIPNAKTLVISEHPDRHTGDGVVSVGVDELDRLRRAFNRVTKNGRQLIRQSKQGLVHDYVLNRIDPERFQRTVQVAPPLVGVRREGSRQAITRERAERRTNVQVVRKQLDELVTEAPQELMMLHAEIERVTLAKMIEAFQTKLAGNLNESAWQKFFEVNKFVLSLAFARPVELAHTQFHAKGSTLTGSGAQIGDFLFKEHGQALAIVEIKTPATILLRAKAYRGEEVFGPTSELSGAVTQVLFQQNELRQRWMYHRNDTPGMQQSGADAIKCVVVAGTLPTAQTQLRSFEVFRTACKDVDIITFDELLAKLEFLERHLTSGLQEDLF